METSFSEIAFLAFQPGDLDALTILEYAKEDTALLLPTDSFAVTPDRRPTGGETVLITLPRSINLNHNYEVRLLRPALRYRITGMALRERRCTKGCDFFRPAYEEPYQRFGAYYLNGGLVKADRLQIQK